MGTRTLKHLGTRGTLLSRLIEYSNSKDYIYKKILKNTIQFEKIVSDGMIAGIHNNEKLNEIVNGLFNKGRKLNISLIFITHNHILKYQKMLD